ncbi:MAG TPA: glutathione S-transferase family protein [Lysobacter sp.]|nr:glutathione S-transferase family protein [Lysobacter sp.]
MSTLTLVSHALCPYVQRAAILLREKQVPFERRDVDLGNKPDWFLRISPLGKTPVLLVGDTPLFESAVINEYLDETRPPRLHSDDPLVRARHRAWVEFASAVLNLIGGFYGAPDEATLAARVEDLRARFRQLEAELGDGPFFAGATFNLVDAAFAPAFRYFEVLDPDDGFKVFAGLPKVQAWRRALAARPSVREAVAADYPERLRAFVRARRSALARRLDAAAAA